MSRIAAVFHREAAPIGPAVLQRMAAPAGGPPSAFSRSLTEGPAGLAFAGLRGGIDDGQPGRLTGGLAICFDGRIDNRDELIADLRDEAGPQPRLAPDWRLALACYRRHGEAFAARINGDFALAIHDRAQQRLLLARDAVGLRPLYYWSGAALLLAASEIKSILAHEAVEAAPDADALADLLAGGDPTERRLTPFRGIRRLLPGHTLLATPGAVREIRHWDFDPTRRLHCRSEAEYAEVMRALFEQAVRRRLRTPGPVAVLVSGGIDSSAILCQAEALRQSGEALPALHPLSNLYPAGCDADERVYLDAIEARWPVAIRRLAPEPIRTAATLEWARRIEQPALFGSPYLAGLAAAREQGCSVVLHGYYGDQLLWTPAHLFDPLRRMRLPTALARLRGLAASLSYSSVGELGREILRDFLRELAPDALLRPYRALRRLRGRRAAGWYARAFRDLAYRRSQRQRRPRIPGAGTQARLCHRLIRAPHVAAHFENWNKAAAAFGLEQAYPFADRDLIEFVMAIPGDALALGAVCKGLFRESMRGILPEAIRTRNDKADFTQLEVDAAALLAGSTAGLLAGGEAVRRGFVDPAALASAVAAQRALLTGEDFTPALQLNQLHALELWLRAFFTPGAEPGDRID